MSRNFFRSQVPAKNDNFLVDVDSRARKALNFLLSRYAPGNVTENFTVGIFFSFSSRLFSCVNFLGLVFIPFVQRVSNLFRGSFALMFCWFI